MHSRKQDIVSRRCCVIVTNGRYNRFRSTPSTPRWCPFQNITDIFDDNVARGHHLLARRKARAKNRSRTVYQRQIASATLTVSGAGDAYIMQSATLVQIVATLIQTSAHVTNAAILAIALAFERVEHVVLISVAFARAVSTGLRQQVLFLQVVLCSQLGHYGMLCVHQLPVFYQLSYVLLFSGREQKDERRLLFFLRCTIPKSRK